MLFFLLPILLRQLSPFACLLVLPFPLLHPSLFILLFPRLPPRAPHAFYLLLPLAPYLPFPFVIPVPLSLLLFRVTSLCLLFLPRLLFPAFLTLSPLTRIDAAAVTGYVDAVASFLRFSTTELVLWCANAVEAVPLLPLLLMAGVACFPLVNRSSARLVVPIALC